MAKKMAYFFISIATLLLTNVATAIDIEYGWQRPRQILPADVTAPSDPLYRRECGTCHFTYPAGFLPARSWQTLMGNLQNHFGENAELDANTQKQLLSYLETHAADRSRDIGSIRLMQRLAPNTTPLRLTETEYLRLRHRNVLPKFIHNNPLVKGFSDCGACHIRGEQGYFNEQMIVIPGFSR